MNAQHTQEPWEVSEETFDNDGAQESVIRALNGRAAVAVTLEFGPNNPGMREANARRIVACVNACKGVETSTLASVGDSLLARTLQRARELHAELEETRALLTKAQADCAAAEKIGTRLKVGMKLIEKTTGEAGFKIGGPVEHCDAARNPEHAEELLLAAHEYLKGISLIADMALSDCHPDETDPNVGKWCWWLDEEPYRMADTEAEAHAQACAHIDDQIEEGTEVTYYVGRVAHPVDLADIKGQSRRGTYTARQSIGEQVVEQIDEWAGDACAAEESTIDLLPSDIAALGDLIFGFVRRLAKASWYGVQKESQTEHRHVAKNEGEAA